MEPNTSYYLGIWNSDKWKEAKKLLLKKYTIDDYQELFSLDQKFDSILTLEKLIKTYDEAFVIDFFLPILQSIALSSENIKQEIPILLNNCKKIIKLTQFECASILSTFFLNMYGNENEGRKEEELLKLNYELDSFPNLSFIYYLYSPSKLMYNKMLFMIRYFIKIGIRMAMSKNFKLVFSEGADFLSSKDKILDKVKDFKKEIKDIYNFDEEFKIDCEEERNSILKIYLNEFNPILIKKDFENKSIDNDYLNEQLNQEFNNYFKQISQISYYGDGISKTPIEIIENKNNIPNKYLKIITENLFLNNPNEVTLDYLESKTKIHIDSITEQKNNIITNFANKYLGGGCMHLGSVQEEILLLICPEILVARAFVKKMNHIQSISMSGFEIISKSQGYGNSLKYGTYNIDKTPYVNNSFKSLMIAVDAYPIYGEQIWTQINPIFSMRELIKFITGLQGNREEVLGFKFDFCSTGKWGCGAFGGDVYMKFLIQFIACLFFDIGFNFSCFNDEKTQKKLKDFIQKLKIVVKEKWEQMQQKKQKEEKDQKAQKEEKEQKAQKEEKDQKPTIPKKLIFRAFIEMNYNKKNVNDILGLYIKTLKNIDPNNA